MPVKQKSASSSSSSRKYKMSEVIPLWLDGYDDIFSDFDSRPYSQRALSVDFLDEAKRASRDKSSTSIELELLLDKKKRNQRHELLIKRRLRNHFNHHFELLKKERYGMTNRGISFVFLGIIIMVLATFVMFNLGESSLYTTFLIVMLEPAGWFLFWEGLNMVLFESKKETRDLRFYEKMTKCDIKFLSN